MKSLIVMPTYNERENITAIVEEIVRYAPQVDMLIIDDNSPDGTGKIADALHERFAQVSTLHRTGKLGLGTAYIAGFRYALEHGYDLAFEMDADFSHDPGHRQPPPHVAVISTSSDFGGTLVVLRRAGIDLRPG